MADKQFCQTIYTFAGDRRVIVQAGGCCGMYPHLWSDHLPIRAART